ncbi:ComEC/Rec2 family competence protein [Riemerella anatipestifer]|uniref:ComEC/Rec2 family competence protein n=1 Tax=Riemerella anatipestifer TaxID=34085 RepID=UPI00288AEF9D|nr:ComEC/Rec2 family competence protein [Riemerella anatipestifer]
MKKQILFSLFISFSLGVFLQDLSELSWQQSNIITTLGAISLGLIWVKADWLVRGRIWLLNIFFLCFGVFTHYLNSEKSVLPSVSKKEDLVFKIDQKLNSTAKNKRYEITVFHQKQLFKAVLSVPKDLEDLDYKHYYQSQLSLYPLESSKNNYQFDYAKFQARKGVYYRAYAKDLRKAPKSELTFSEKMKQWRLEFLSNIDKNEKLSQQTRAFLKGIVLADRTEVDAGTNSNFRRSGLAHILAISGTHIAIIFGVVYMLLRLVLPVRFRIGVMLLSLSLIWAFAWFIGWGNSVVRACIMLTVYFGFVLLQRKPQVLDSLALAGLGILMVDTQELFSVGFQLSFSAVLGIYWFNRPMIRLFPNPRNKIQKLLLYTFTMSTAAQLGTMPIVIYYFHQYSAWSILANLLVLPLMEIVIILSFLMTIVFGLGIYWSWLSFTYDWLIKALLWLIGFFGKIEVGSFQDIPLSIWEMGVWAVGLYFLREILIRFTWRGFMRLMFSVLLFFGIKMWLDIRAYHDKEARWHYHYRTKVFSVLDKGEVYFWVVDKDNLETLESNLIKPYVISKRAKSYKIKMMSRSK